MGISFGAEDVKSEDDIAGNARPVPGRYHAVVKDVKFQIKTPEKVIEVEEDEPFEKVVVTFEALKGTVPGQENRELPEYFATSERAIERLRRLAIVLELLKPGEKEKQIRFSEAVGRQLVIEVEDNEYEKAGKTIKSVRVAYLGFWSVGNKEVADVPKDENALKLASGGGRQEPSQEGSQEAAPAAASSASDDKWADL
jgi:hypothetical protein